MSLLTFVIQRQNKLFPSRIITIQMVSQVQLRLQRQNFSCSLRDFTGNLSIFNGAPTWKLLCPVSFIQTHGRDHQHRSCSPSIDQSVYLPAVNLYIWLKSVIWQILVLQNTNIQLSHWLCSSLHLHLTSISTKCETNILQIDALEVKAFVYYNKVCFTKWQTFHLDCKLHRYRTKEFITVHNNE